MDPKNLMGYRGMSQEVCRSAAVELSNIETAAKLSGTGDAPIAPPWFRNVPGEFRTKHD